jgi:chondroitin AC lyase
MAPASYYKETGVTAETMKSKSTSTYQNSSLEYLRHGKFGYFFPEQGNIKLTMKAQNGSWYQINRTKSVQSFSKDVFSLWFDHGSNPVNETYSYIVVPGIDSEEKASAYDMAEIEIVENTQLRQAVYHKTLDLLQVIFHEAGTIVHNGRSISINQPCALMFEKGTLVTIADPEQLNFNTIQVTINVNGSEYTEYITMPSSTELKGSSVAVDFGILSNIQNETVKAEMIITPNPTKGILHISLGNQRLLNVEVININGQIISKNSFNGGRKLDITGYPSGIYFIKAIDEEGQTYQQKIIKY